MHQEGSHFLYSPEFPHVGVENDSNELPVECDFVSLQIMYARDASRVSSCCVVFFLATYHLDGRMDLSVETVLDSNRRHVPESIS